MNELPSQYNPKLSEDKWYKFWEDKGLFCARINSSKEPFSIVIPPPNVTGILHMGHALNNTIQDILIRYQRMMGREALWMPGTDHAGIATQNVVEKAIAKQGLKRQDLGRERFLGRVWAWKQEYGSTIIKQLKKLGACCDWSRTRFTMDREYSQSVLEVFINLYEKGLIYRDSKIINWCPRCQTALSDEEAPHQEIKGALYYIKYPLIASRSLKHKFIIVATTRPETMLGDTAVAVHPKDRRYKKLIGNKVNLPLINREIPIIADEMVDKKFGTGAVKVTPCHDPNDYCLGKKHKLEFVNIMHPDGRLNQNAGRYKDMDRFRGREVIIEDLKKGGLLEKIEAHELSAGHCYRCHTIIEPYLSPQWFVNMKPLARPAIEVVKKDKIKFYPGRWRKVYLNWMENIEDWCISRQIWWGHQIPAWYCLHCHPELKSYIVTESEGGVLNGPLPSSERQYPTLKDNATVRALLSRIEPVVSKQRPRCSKCNSRDGMVQDLDVLDTWFSSWLWPFATFYWPFQNQDSEDKKRCEELNYFYPTSVLVTAPEIIFFWVARMIMAGLEFMKKIPFSDVYIHGTVRDVEGRKMSKSLGNIIDPLEVIEHIGSDALRFSLISITASGQDVFLSEEKFRKGRNFANKIWNASRLILMNLDVEKTRQDLCVCFKAPDLSWENRWILSRFYSSLKDIRRAFEKYRFNEAANLLYQFFWHEFCDWYLEMIKPKIKDPRNQLVMYKMLEKFLRALHPFMPFITEEIWQKIPHEGESIMNQPLPHIQSEMIDKKIEQRMELAFNIITCLRNILRELKIPAGKKVNILIHCKDKNLVSFLSSILEHILRLAKLNQVQFVETPPLLKSRISLVLGKVNIFIPAEGLIDIAREQARINKEIDGIGYQLGDKIKRLKNKKFIENAPLEVVDAERERVKNLKDRLSELKKISHELKLS